MDEYPEINNTNFSFKIAEKFKEFDNKKKYDSNINSNLKLFGYQKVIEKYLDKESPYRGLLLYFGLGSGKTLTAINVAENLGRKVIVLLPKSLKQNFENELMKYIYSNVNEIKKKYTFISSNSSTSSKTLEKTVLDNKLLIIDEVHNLLVNIINPNTINGIRIYKQIMKAKNLKILALSGSPIVNDPYELAMLFNILRGPIKMNKKQIVQLFPDYQEFNDIFINKKTNTIQNKGIFQDRITGLVSYYNTEKSELLPLKHEPIIKQVPMSDYQFKKYIQIRSREIDQERKVRFAKEEFVKVANKKPARSVNTTFRVHSREVCNFAFPIGIEKPKFTSQKEVDVKVKKVLSELSKGKYLTENLKKYSPKMSEILKSIKNSKGNLIVYSQFLALEGIGILSKVLEKNGYNNFNLSKKTNLNTFAIFSGNTDDKLRKKIIDTYNSIENKDGHLIKILLITSAASEGISLKNVREVHIIEPFFNLSRLKQVIGRAVRLNSHIDLPENERDVYVFIYISDKPINVSKKDMEKSLDEINTTDQHLLLMSIKKQRLIEQFLNSIKEASIDCIINHENCRICIPTNEKLYPANLKDHLLPGNQKCITEKTIITDLKSLPRKNDSDEVLKKDSEGRIFKRVPGKKELYIQVN